MTEDTLVDVAMQIIVNAGDARGKLSLALKQAKASEFYSACEAIAEAEELVQKAHKEQTTIIQAEASGAQYQLSLLFIHAQDTLMTVNSELRLTREMVDILKLIEERLRGGERT